MTLPEELHRLDGPVFGDEAIGELDNDLTRQHAGEPLGERIIVTGRVLDEDGRPIAGTLVEVWQANAGGATGTRSTSTRRRSTRTSPAPAAASPTTTAATASSRSSPARTRGATTRTPGGRAHIHFSVFGRAFTQRLVTQMYFPGDPLFEFDPIFHSVRDPKARELLVARFDLADDAARVGARLPVGHRARPRRLAARRRWRTAVTLAATPSQTVGPFYAIGLCRAARRTSSSPRTTRRR